MSQPVKAVDIEPECSSETTGYRETDQINDTIKSLDRNLSELSDSLKVRFRSLVCSQLSLLKYRETNPDWGEKLSQWNAKEIKKLKEWSPYANDKEDRENILNNSQAIIPPKYRNIVIERNKTTPVAKKYLEYQDSKGTPSSSDREFWRKTLLYTNTAKSHSNKTPGHESLQIDDGCEKMKQTVNTKTTPDTAIDDLSIKSDAEYNAAHSESPNELESDFNDRIKGECQNRKILGRDTEHRSQRDNTNTVFGESSKNRGMDWKEGSEVIPLNYDRQSQLNQNIKREPDGSIVNDRERREVDDHRIYSDHYPHFQTSEETEGVADNIIHEPDGRRRKNVSISDNEKRKENGNSHKSDCNRGDILTATTGPDKYRQIENFTGRSKTGKAPAKHGLSDSAEVHDTQPDYPLERRGVIDKDDFYRNKEPTKSVLDDAITDNYLDEINRYPETRSKAFGPDQNVKPSFNENTFEAQDRRYMPRGNRDEIKQYSPTTDTHFNDKTIRRIPEEYADRAPNSRAITQENIDSSGGPKSKGYTKHGPANIYGTFAADKSHEDIGNKHYHRDVRRKSVKMTPSEEELQSKIGEIINVKPKSDNLQDHYIDKMNRPKETLSNTFNSDRQVSMPLNENTLESPDRRNMSRDNRNKEKQDSSTTGAYFDDKNVRRVPNVEYDNRAPKQKQHKQDIYTSGGPVRKEGHKHGQANIYDNFADDSHNDIGNKHNLRDVRPKSVSRGPSEEDLQGRRGDSTTVEPKSDNLLDNYYEEMNRQQDTRSNTIGPDHQPKMYSNENTFEPQNSRNMSRANSNKIKQDSPTTSSYFDDRNIRRVPNVEYDNRAPKPKPHTQEEIDSSGGPIRTGGHKHGQANMYHNFADDSQYGTSNKHFPRDMRSKSVKSVSSEEEVQSQRGEITNVGPKTDNPHDNFFDDMNTPEEFRSNTAGSDQHASTSLDENTREFPDRSNMSRDIRNKEKQDSPTAGAYFDDKNVRHVPNAEYDNRAPKRKQHKQDIYTSGGPVKKEGHKHGQANIYDNYADDSHNDIGNKHYPRDVRPKSVSRGPSEEELQSRRGDSTTVEPKSDNLLDNYYEEMNRQQDTRSNTIGPDQQPKMYSNENTFEPQNSRNMSRDNSNKIKQDSPTTSSYFDDRNIRSVPNVEYDNRAPKPRPHTQEDIDSSGGPIRTGGHKYGQANMYHNLADDSHNGTSNKHFPRDMRPKSVKSVSSEEEVQSQRGEITNVGRKTDNLHDNDFDDMNTPEEFRSNTVGSDRQANTSLNENTRESTDRSNMSGDIRNKENQDSPTTGTYFDDENVRRVPTAEYDNRAPKPRQHKQEDIDISGGPIKASGHKHGQANIYDNLADDSHNGTSNEHYPIDVFPKSVKIVPPEEELQSQRGEATNVGPKTDNLPDSYFDEMNTPQETRTNTTGSDRQANRPLNENTLEYPDKRNRSRDNRNNEKQHSPTTETYFDVKNIRRVPNAEYDNRSNTIDADRQANTPLDENTIESKKRRNMSRDNTYKEKQHSQTAGTYFDDKNVRRVPNAGYDNRAPKPRQHKQEDIGSSGGPIRAGSHNYGQANIYDNLADDSHNGTSNEHYPIDVRPKSVSRGPSEEELQSQREEITNVTPNSGNLHDNYFDKMNTPKETRSNTSCSDQQASMSLKENTLESPDKGTMSRDNRNKEKQDEPTISTYFDDKYIRRFPNAGYDNRAPKPRQHKQEDIGSSGGPIKAGGHTHGQANIYDNLADDSQNGTSNEHYPIDVFPKSVKIVPSEDELQSQRGEGTHVGPKTDNLPDSYFDEMNTPQETRSNTTGSDRQANRPLNENTLEYPDKRNRSRDNRKKEKQHSPTTATYFDDKNIRRVPNAEYDNRSNTIDADRQANTPLNENTIESKKRRNMSRDNRNKEKHHSPTAGTYFDDKYVHRVPNAGYDNRAPKPRQHEQEDIGSSGGPIRTGGHKHGQANIYDNLADDSYNGTSNEYYPIDVFPKSLKIVPSEEEIPSQRGEGTNVGPKTDNLLDSFFDEMNTPQETRSNTTGSDRQTNRPLNENALEYPDRRNMSKDNRNKEKQHSPTTATYFDDKNIRCVPNAEYDNRSNTSGADRQAITPLNDNTIESKESRNMSRDNRYKEKQHSPTPGSYFDDENVRRVPNAEYDNRAPKPRQHKHEDFGSSGGPIRAGGHKHGQANFYDTFADESHDDTGKQHYPRDMRPKSVSSGQSEEELQRQRGDITNVKPKSGYLHDNYFDEINRPKESRSNTSCSDQQASMSLNENTLESPDKGTMSRDNRNKEKQDEPTTGTYFDDKNFRRVPNVEHDNRAPKPIPHVQDDVDRSVGPITTGGHKHGQANIDYNFADDSYNGTSNKHYPRDMRPTLVKIVPSEEELQSQRGEGTNVEPKPDSLHDNYFDNMNTPKVTRSNTTGSDRQANMSLNEDTLESPDRRNMSRDKRNKVKQDVPTTVAYFDDRSIRRVPNKEYENLAPQPRQHIQEETDISGGPLRTGGHKHGHANMYDNFADDSQNGTRNKHFPSEVKPKSVKLVSSEEKLQSQRREITNEEQKADNLRDNIPQRIPSNTSGADRQANMSLNENTLETPDKRNMSRDNRNKVKQDAPTTEIYFDDRSIRRFPNEEYDTRAPKPRPHIQEEFDSSGEHMRTGGRTNRPASVYDTFADNSHGDVGNKHSHRDLRPKSVSRGNSEEELQSQRGDNTICKRKSGNLHDNSGHDRTYSRRAPETADDHRKMYLPERSYQRNHPFSDYRPESTQLSPEHRTQHRRQPQPRMGTLNKAGPYRHHRVTQPEYVEVENFGELYPYPSNYEMSHADNLETDPHNQVAANQMMDTSTGNRNMPDKKIEQTLLDGQQYMNTRKGNERSHQPTGRMKPSQQRSHGAQGHVVHHPEAMSNGVSGRNPNFTTKALNEVPKNVLGATCGSNVPLHVFTDGESPTHKTGNVSRHANNQMPISDMYRPIDREPEHRRDQSYNTFDESRDIPRTQDGSRNAHGNIYSAESTSDKRVKPIDICQDEYNNDFQALCEENFDLKSSDSEIEFQSIKAQTKAKKQHRAFNNEMIENRAQKPRPRKQEDIDSSEDLLIKGDKEHRHANIYDYVSDDSHGNIGNTHSHRDARPKSVSRGPYEDELQSQRGVNTNVKHKSGKLHDNSGHVLTYPRRPSETADGQRRMYLPERSYQRNYPHSDYRPESAHLSPEHRTQHRRQPPPRMGTLNKAGPNGHHRGTQPEYVEVENFGELYPYPSTYEMSHADNLETDPHNQVAANQMMDTSTGNRNMPDQKIEQTLLDGQQYMNTRKGNERSHQPTDRMKPFQQRSRGAQGHVVHHPEAMSNDIRGKTPNSNTMALDDGSKNILGATGGLNEPLHAFTDGESPVREAGNVFRHAVRQMQNSDTFREFDLETGHITDQAYNKLEENRDIPSTIPGSKSPPGNRYAVESTDDKRGKSSYKYQDEHHCEYDFDLKSSDSEGELQPVRSQTKAKRRYRASNNEIFKALYDENRPSDLDADFHTNQLQPIGKHPDEHSNTCQRVPINNLRQRKKDRQRVSPSRSQYHGVVPDQSIPSSVNAFSMGKEPSKQRDRRKQTRPEDFEQPSPNYPLADISYTEIPDESHIPTTDGFSDVCSQRVRTFEQNPNRDDAIGNDRNLPYDDIEERRYSSIVRAHRTRNDVGRMEGNALNSKNWNVADKNCYRRHYYLVHKEMVQMNKTIVTTENMLQTTRIKLCITFTTAPDKRELFQQIKHVFTHFSSKSYAVSNRIRRILGDLKEVVERLDSKGREEGYSRDILEAESSLYMTINHAWPLDDRREVAATFDELESIVQDLKDAVMRLGALHSQRKLRNVLRPILKDLEGVSNFLQSRCTDEGNRNLEFPNSDYNVREARQGQGRGRHVMETGYQSQWTDDITLAHAHTAQGTNPVAIQPKERNKTLVCTYLAGVLFGLLVAVMCWDMPGSIDIYYGLISYIYCKVKLEHYGTPVI